MKFTKEDAVKDLAAKFKEKDKDLDLSRTINEHVDNTLQLVSGNEEMELSTFVSIVEKNIVSSVGFMRHEVSSAMKTKETEIDELKKKIPSTNPPANPPEENEELKSLKERLQALEDERNRNEKSKRIAEKKTSLIAKIKEGGVKNDEWINDTLAKVAIAEDLDVDAEAKYYVDTFNKYFSDTNPNVTPRRSTTPNSPKVNPVLDKVKELQKARTYIQPEQK